MPPCLPCPALPQVRFHLPVWLGVGEALNQMIKDGKLELLQVRIPACLPACLLLPAHAWLACLSALQADYTRYTHGIQPA